MTSPTPETSFGLEAFVDSVLEWRIVRCADKLFGTVCLLLLSLGGLQNSAAQNLAQNPGFESGVSGWFGLGSVAFSTPTTQPHSGVRAAFVQNRTATWNGVAQSVKGILQAGKTYRISAWVRAASGGDQPFQLTMQKTDGGGTNTIYTAIASGSSNSTNWTQLTGSYTFTVSGSLTTLTLYVEGPAAGVNFYADDFVVEIYDSNAWKAQANARIEEIRKRDVQLVVVDPDGHALSNATIDIKQTRHRFAFGSAINNNISNPKYASFFQTNFEWAVMENESKWYYNEPSRSNVTYTVANSITNFCFTNGITLRGHALFWAVDQYVQPWVTNLSNSALLVHLTNRLDSAVGHFKGTFKHWDVNNEMLHGNYFGNRLGNWVNDWMFKYARSRDPNVELFVNDYNVVAGNETDAYKRQINALLATNAPVTGIGVQGHFGDVIDPLTTELRLDSLAELGLPIWITEYDSANADENVRADNLEKLYRLSFSKPAVNGVLMWGFWAGSHWRGADAAIVNMDWTVNAAGIRYQSLLKEWTTTTNGTSDAAGVFPFRGVHGDYDIMVTPPGGQPTLRRISVEPGSTPSKITLIAHAAGSQPQLYLAPEENPTPLRFQLFGDAGRSYAIQSATNLTSPGWRTINTISNTTGVLWFTNLTGGTSSQQFFRAQLLP